MYLRRPAWGICSAGRAPPELRAGGSALRAAAQRDAYAQTALGDLYREGEGVPRDVARVTALLKAAAAGGSEEAALRALGEDAPP